MKLHNSKLPCFTISGPIASGKTHFVDNLLGCLDTEIFVLTIRSFDMWSHEVGRHYVSALTSGLPVVVVLDDFQDFTPVRAKSLGNLILTHLDEIRRGVPLTFPNDIPPVAYDPKLLGFIKVVQDNSFGLTVKNG